MNNFQKEKLKENHPADSGEDLDELTFDIRIICGDLEKQFIKDE